MGNTILKKPSWVLQDTVTFSSATLITRDILIPKGSYSEILIIGGNMTAIIPIVDGITSYSVTSYNNYSGYGMRLQSGVNISDPTKIAWSIRLEEKLQNTGYPTVRLYTR